jgi:Flp pilus assembly protein TadD
MEIVQTLDGAVRQAEAYWHAGHVATARTICQQALSFAPECAAALRLMAQLSLSDGDAPAAVALARRATAAETGHVDGWRLLGAALAAGADWPGAADAFAAADRLVPNEPSTLYHLGQAQAHLGRMDEATTLLRRAALLGHDRVDIQICCGLALRDCDDVDGAIACLERAVALAPTDAVAHMNLGLTHLLAGHWATGWQEYEWRHGIHSGQPWRWPRLGVRLEDIAGKRVLVAAEQGFGDIIQFARLLPTLAAHCASVTWEVYPALAPLLAGQYDNVRVVPTGRAAAPADVVLPIMSLGALLQVAPTAIPGTSPFLTPDPAKVALWRERVDMAAPLRLGLVWSTSEPHSHRSFSLEIAQPLLEVPGVRVHLLQMGAGRQDLDNGGVPSGTIDVAARIGGFDDTAAIMSLMDVVISPCTVTTHLAAALGRPTWVALSTNSDWRWLLGRDDNPWYPTARLFRQRRAGDWQPVMQDMAAQLAALAVR